MIISKADLLYYLLEDANAHGISEWRWRHMFMNPPLYFQRQLRRVEYYGNCRHDILGRGWLIVLKIKFTALSIYFGFTIPPNTCGPGLVINHWGTIVISSLAIIGRGCRINTCVNIGVKHGKAPMIGKNVYIGPGAVLFGDISIGDNVSIGANAVVTQSFPDFVTVAGVPAIIISRPKAENELS